jgi:hypothetical protein
MQTSLPEDHPGVFHEMEDWVNNLYIIYIPSPQKSIMARNTLGFGFLCLLCFISLISLSNAVCQYADMKNISNTVPTYYYNNQKLTVAPVIITAYAHTDTGQYLTCSDNFKDSFNVINQVNGKVNIKLFYTFNGQLKTQDITLNPKETKQISEIPYRACPVGSCQLAMCQAPPPQLDEKSISVAVEDGNGLELRQDIVTQEQRICRQCPANSGQNCLDDDQKANYAAMCGSGLINASNICISQSRAKIEEAQSKDIGYQIGSFFGGIWKAITDLIWQIFMVIVAIIIAALVIWYINASSRGGGYGYAPPPSPEEPPDNSGVEINIKIPRSPRDRY